MRKIVGGVFFVFYVFLKNLIILYVWCLNVIELYIGTVEIIIEYNFCFIKLDFLIYYFV